jgi:hypothetical protein
MKANPASGAEGLWSVWRQDDNGNRCEIDRGLPRKAAEKTVKKFEERGHKQTYWIEPGSPGQGEEISL